MRKLLGKTAVQIFFAILLVTLVTFGSSYYVFTNSTTAIYGQVMENARVTAKSVAKSFDECFKEINNTIYSLNLLHLQIYDDNGYENLNMSNVYLLTNNAKQLINQEYIYDYVIHFSKSGLAVTSEGTMELTDMFNKKFGNVKYPPEFWSNFASFKHTMKIIPSSNYVETSDDGRKYDRKLIGIVGNNKMSSSKFNIVLFVDEKLLLEAIGQKNMGKEASLAILDQDRQVVFNTEKKFDADILNEIKFQGSSEASVRIGGFEYYCIQSDYSDFLFINKIPFEYAQAQPEIRQNSCIMIVTICLVLVLSALLSLYLYRPVQRTLRLMENSAAGDEESDLARIHSQVRQLMAENRMYRCRLETAESDIKQQVFLAMIDPESGPEEFKEAAELYFRNIFAFGCFVIVLFLFEPAGEPKHVPPGKNSPKRGAVAEQLEELLNCRFRAEVFPMGNSSYAALIGVNPSIPRGELLVQLQHTVARLAKSEDAGNNLLAAVSRSCSGSQDCSAAYRDISACLAFRRLSDQYCVIDYETLDFSSDMYFPYEQIEKLSNFILSGNGKEAKDIVNRIFDTNWENGVSVVKFKMVAGIIFNNLMELMELCPSGKDEISRLEQDYFDRLNCGGCTARLQPYFNGLIDRIAGQAGSRKHSKLNKEFVVEYINLHYAEDLYLESMAQITETSPKYFSNFFKKAVGTNFIEYLNKIRISHARELLKNTEILVSEIGERVGFKNSSTFTSTFKKFCGVSPLEYRKDH